MVTYTVHERDAGDADIATRADAIVFVKEGFAWLALPFPVLWMLYHRLWLVLFGFVAIAAAAHAGLTAAGVGSILGVWLSIALSAMFALLANDLRRRKLARKDYRLVDVVSGRNRQECETRFFDGWLAAQGLPADALSPAARHFTRKSPAPSKSGGTGSPDDEVIGLFPDSRS